MDGIVLLAIGNQSYASWAFNIALSIKYHSNVPIQLIYQPETIKNLNAFHRSFFDILTKIDNNHVYDDSSGKYKLSPARAKLNLYKYLEFDNNLILDVDGVTVKSLEPIFKLCKNFYSVQTTAYMTKTNKPDKVQLWANASQIWGKYRLNDKAMFPIVETGFQFMRKSNQLNQLFSLAMSYYTNPIPLKEFKITWGKSQPDELYLGVALAELGIKCNFPKEIKSLHATYKDHIVEGEIADKYYMFGLWGNKTLPHDRLKSYYDRLINKYSKKWNRHIEFKCRKLLNHKFVTVDRR